VAQLRVWAPDAREVTAVVGDAELAMAEGHRGWWELNAAELGHGVDYALRVDGGDPRPDPRSLWQPAGVHAASRFYDHSRFGWTDATWRGVALPGSVLYELHVGTFTPAGTFDAALDKLDHLVELGIDAIELLPVASYDGTVGWGYDGVALYAAHEPYGGPDGLKRFVDACHARGLGVVLDVVYNHLGPSGNYLSEFGPYFTDTHTTPWGPAVNLDAEGSDEVRSFIIGNALSWLRDFHIDGLRLDAVHALVDNRAIHLLEELATAVHSLGSQTGRPLFLVAESDLNDPRLVTPVEARGMGLDAQWADDIHHALHASLPGERQGYYADFGSLAALGATMESVFFHADTWSSFRGRRHGRPVDRLHLSGQRFVTYLQNHDQIGNRATGDRLAANLSIGMLKVGAALLFTAAFTPQLFMGEEWAASTPWQFFTSFPDPELGRAVTEGRREEFAEHGWDDTDIPDPQSRSTFEASRLDWSEVEKPEHAEMLDWHRQLITMRRARPELTDGRLDRVQCSSDEDARWFVMQRGPIAVVCNLCDERRVVPVAGIPRELLLASTPGFVYREGLVELDGESVVVVTLVD
jgi:maltooligosyltrehalose trehalohydrolase